MLRSKIKQILFFILGLLVLSCLTSSCLILRYLPDNQLSIALLKTVYELPFGKRSLLEFYSPARKGIRGHVPIEINQFLIQRLEGSNDENEISAIVNFYALQASEHRLGYLIHISEQVKLKVVNQTIKEFDDETTLDGKLMMLEEIRTGKSLGKGNIFAEGMDKPYFITLEEDEIWRKEHEKWFDEQLKTIGKTKYQEWWNSNLSWEEKKKINPLDGTNIKVSECCG